MISYGYLLTVRPQETTYHGDKMGDSGPVPITPAMVICQALCMFPSLVEIPSFLCRDSYRDLMGSSSISDKLSSHIPSPQVLMLFYALSKVRSLIIEHSRIPGSGRKIDQVTESRKKNLIDVSYVKELSAAQISQCQWSTLDLCSPNSLF